MAKIEALLEGGSIHGPPAQRAIGAVRFDQALRLANKSEARIKLLKNEPEALAIGLIWPDTVTQGGSAKDEASNPTPAGAAAAAAGKAAAAVTATADAAVKTTASDSDSGSAAAAAAATSSSFTPAFDSADVMNVWRVLASGGDLVYPHHLFDHSPQPQGKHGTNTKLRYEGHIRVSLPIS